MGRLRSILGGGRTRSADLHDIERLLDPPARWPLVLWVMKPAGVSGFVGNGTARDLYLPPQVGMFETEIAREIALAAVIGSYLSELGRPVQIAPPLLAATLRGSTRFRVASLERTWTLPATEVVSVRR